MVKKRETVTVDDADNRVTVTVNLSAIIEKGEDSGYVIYCPSLKLCSQGESHAEAKKNIIESVDLFIESCVARKKLGDALVRRGFSKTETPNKAEYKKTQLHIETNNGRKISKIAFPVELPLAA